MHVSVFNKFKQHLDDLMPSWGEGNSVWFQQGAELKEQRVGFSILAVSVLVTASGSLLSFCMLGGCSVWKGVLAVWAPTVDLSCIQVNNFV